MSNHTLLSKFLLACISISLLSTGVINIAYSGESNSTEKQQSTPNIIQGKVTDTFVSAGYTYAEVDTGKEKVWAATAATPLKSGDTVSFSASMPMENYHSLSLKREFPLIYFVNQFNTDPANAKIGTQSAASAHAHVATHQTNKTIKQFSKFDGGNTIAELYTDKARLNGQTIHVRGQVTKVTTNVMGKNWIHISDNSTQNDLTITTTDTAAIDDVVVITGKLSQDKDFNYGYVYPLIIEDATISKE